MYCLNGLEKYDSHYREIKVDTCTRTCIISYRDKANPTCTLYFLLTCTYICMMTMTIKGTATTPSKVHYENRKPCKCPTGLQVLDYRKALQVLYAEQHTSPHLHICSVSMGVRLWQ